MRDYSEWELDKNPKHKKTRFWDDVRWSNGHEMIMIWYENDMIWWCYGLIMILYNPFFMLFKKNTRFPRNSRPYDQGHLPKGFL